MTKPKPVSDEACADSTNANQTNLPTHVQQAIQAIAAMHAAHRERASWLDQFIDRLTGATAKANFLLILAILLVVWTALNVSARYLGFGAFDDPPTFPLLSFLVSCAELFIAVLILASQTRADRLANLREQMTLETVLLNTQKSSKLIELMEEFRRDSPSVKDRVDVEAMEMAGRAMAICGQGKETSGSSVLPTHKLRKYLTSQANIYPERILTHNLRYTDLFENSDRILITENSDQISS